MLQDKFLRTSLKIIALLVIIYLTWKVGFVFRPIYAMSRLLVAPLVFSLFLYYLLRPVVRYLDGRRMNRTAAILLLYFVLFGLMIILVYSVWPTLQRQLNELAASSPRLAEDLGNQIYALQKNSFLSSVVPNESDSAQKLSEYLDRGVSIVTESLNGLMSIVTQLVIIIGTVPVVLYFLLKEGEKLPPMLRRAIPSRYRREAREMMAEMDAALSGFIVGRVTVIFLLGVMTYIGFLLIDLPYALLLAAVSMVLNFIPYIGALLGAIPALIVGFIGSPTLAVWVILVTLITQQIENNLISPFVYGKRLDVHPLTVVVLALVAGEIAGILGMFVALPVYMIIKILYLHVYRLFLSEKVEEFVE